MYDEIITAVRRYIYNNDVEDVAMLLCNIMLDVVCGNCSAEIRRSTEEKQSKHGIGGQKMASKTKRKYYRKCGVCGCRHEQSEMVRHDGSPNGWFCIGCWIDYEDPEWEDE